MFFRPSRIRKRRQRISTQNGVACPSSDLWDLIIDMKWDEVITHCKKVPIDAEWTDGHWHETPLYLACQHNPPANAIRAIVQAYPAAVLCPSRANMDLPIHVACRYQASSSVLLELLKDFPVSAVEQSRWGRTPLMALWEYRPKLQNLDDEFWKKVLTLLDAVARFREDPLYRTQKPILNSTTRDFRLPPQQKQKKFQKVDNGQQDIIDTGTTRLLVHAAASLGALGCPTQVLEYVLSAYPEQIKRRDVWGQLPLHIATGPTSWSRVTRRKYKPRERDFISTLLKVDPKAASVKNDLGRYPLHSALANRHTWSGGVDCLFQASPRVLVLRDPVTKLYPFQLASAPMRLDPEGVDLDTIYLLLRSQPDVLLHMDTNAQLQKEKRLEALAQHSLPTITLSRLSGKSGLSMDKYPQHLLKDTVVGTAAAICIGSLTGIVFGSNVLK